VPCVLIESKLLVGQIRDDKIGKAVIVVVSEVNAHAGIGISAIVNRNFGGESDFLERAVAFVVLEELWHGVVGDENVNVPVAIVISDGNAQALAGFRDSDLLRKLP
jgi:hypothetical protein